MVWKETRKENLRQKIKSKSKKFAQNYIHSPTMIPWDKNMKFSVIFSKLGEEKREKLYTLFSLNFFKFLFLQIFFQTKECLNVVQHCLNVVQHLFSLQIFFHFPSNRTVPKRCPTCVELNLNITKVPHSHSSYYEGIVNINTKA